MEESSVTKKKKINDNDNNVVSKDSGTQKDLSNRI